MAKSFTSYENFIHAIAGAAGSVTAMSVFFPLDTVRLKLQLDEELKTKNIFTIINDIINREGVGALYNGIVPVLQSICASNFVYFYSYHGLRNIFYSNTKEKRIVTDLLLGVVAGAVNVLTTTPFWVVNTRIKMQDERRCLENSYLRSMADGLIKISNKEGISALWCGTVPSLILVINPGLYKTILLRLKGMSVFCLFLITLLIYLCVLSI
ncbi:Peroxisomal membrane protein PMP34 [Nymphon striatum]|nr:Peroxisomal membrane protein PMP34 [Nymphon striatum]